MAQYVYTESYRKYFEIGLGAADKIIVPASSSFNQFGGLQMAGFSGALKGYRKPIEGAPKRKSWRDMEREKMTVEEYLMYEQRMKQSRRTAAIFSGIEMQFGNMIRKNSNGGFWNFIPTEISHSGTEFLLFQDRMEASDGMAQTITIISMWRLIDYAKQNPESAIMMPYYIGFDATYEQMPDNVVVLWSKEDEHYKLVYGNKYIELDISEIAGIRKV